MTQKEYQENLRKLEKENKELLLRLEEYELEEDKYKRVLEDYYITKRDLEIQIDRNRMNDAKVEHLKETIEQLKETIEQYEKILNRVTINC